MKRLLFYTTAAVLLIGVIINSGVHPESDQEIDREYANATPWPNIPYATVKAYLYRVQDNANDPAIYNPRVLENGQLVKSVINPDGVNLSSSQIQKLITAISQIPPHRNGILTVTSSLCIFNPHHAFVFYNSGGKMVAWVEICTLCHDVQLSSERKMAYQYDFDAIDSLIAELGLPVFRQDEDVASYRASHGVH